MAERLARCPTCQASDVDQAHADRCAIRTKARAEAIAHGRGDIDIHGAKTADLWAHVHTRTGDPVVARDVVQQVIDLGWRPVVGHHDLWTPPTPVSGACGEAAPGTGDPTGGGRRG